VDSILAHRRTFTLSAASLRGRLDRARPGRCFRGWSIPSSSVLSADSADSRGFCLWDVAGTLQGSAGIGV